MAENNSQGELLSDFIWQSFVCQSLLSLFEFRSPCQVFCRDSPGSTLPRGVATLAVPLKKAYNRGGQSYEAFSSVAFFSSLFSQARLDAGCSCVTGLTAGSGHAPRRAASIAIARGGVLWTICLIPGPLRFPCRPMCPTLGHPIRRYRRHRQRGPTIQGARHGPWAAIWAT